MKNIETKWLYDFLTLEACRHFSQAAEERNISQPAFSRRIKALESAVGVLLFDRTTSPLQQFTGCTQYQNSGGTFSVADDVAQIGALNGGLGGGVCLSR